MRLLCFVAGHSWQEVTVYWSATLIGQAFGSGCDVVLVCDRCKAKRGAKR